MVWSYHCSETCLFIVFSLWPFVTFTQVALPVFKGSGFFCWIFVPAIFCRVAELFTQCEEGSPLPVGRVHLSGCRMALNLFLFEARYCYFVLAGWLSFFSSYFACLQANLPSALII